MRETANPDKTDATTRAMLAELLPAYAIGATDSDETEFVRLMLPHFPDLLVELTAYTALEQALVQSIPPVTPPAQLADRLRSALHSTADAPPARLTAKTVGRGGQPATEAGRPASRSWNRPTGLAVAAALAGLLLLNVYWMAQNSTLRSRQAAVLEQLERQNMALGLLADEEIYRHDLLPADSASDAGGSVIWNDAFRLAILYGDGFQPRKDGSVYQVWLYAQGEEPQSGGTFAVDAGGTGTLVMPISRPLSDFDLLEITLEPAGGSAAPTSPAIVRSSL